MLNSQIGRLTVIAFDKKVNYFNYWTCKCSCGAIKSIREDALRTNRSRSCGCLHTDLQTKHGHTKNSFNNKESYTHISWRSMKSRCLNKNSKDYLRYGGKGIKVCKEWEDTERGFQTFLQDMGERPFKHTLDRIDGTKGYFKANCRWATHTTQAKNRVCH